MNTTMERDTGEHAVQWDPADDDLSYGRHSLARQFDMAGPRSDKLTVAVILDRRTPDEILTTGNIIREGDPTPASAIVRRLTLERTRARVASEPTFPPGRALREYDEATAVLSARRPEPTAGVWWDRDDTPTGVILTDYRPDRKQHHDPDATVGFIPLDSPPPVTQGGNGPDERAYWDDGDLTPANHTTVEPFAPIDTRVKQPWYKSWKGWFGLP